MDNLTNELYRLNRKELEQFIHQNEYAIDKFNELGIKPIFYEKHTFDSVAAPKPVERSNVNDNIKYCNYDKNKAIHDLIQNNEIELVNEFKLDKVKAGLEQKITKKRKLR